VLKGSGPPDVIEVSVELTARMLIVGGVAADRPDADRQVQRAIASGAGLERFRRMLEHQGADPRLVDDYSRLPSAPLRHLVTATRAGYVGKVDAEMVGRASVALGAGRNRMDDPVDPAVGVLLLAKPGDAIAKGDPVFEIHYRGPATLEAALPLATRAVAIADERPAARPLLVAEVH
jgi:thymidine phosphorylase